VSAGSLSYTITDANSCQYILNLTVPQPSPVALSATPQQITCFGLSNGSIAPAVSGGTPAYSFIWTGFDASNNPITLSNSLQQNQSGLAPGTYTVQISDINGCSINSPFYIISNPLTSPTIQNINLVHVNCFNGTTGSISFLATGGTPGYSVYLNGNIQGNIPTSGGLFTLSNLSSGPYALQIIDNNGCSHTENIIINQPNTPLTAVVDNVTNATCFGYSDGAINSTTTGGTAPYSYIWSLIGGVGGPMPPSQAASADPINVPNGNYQLQVTDANGCQTTVITLVNEPTPIQIVWQDSGPLCDGTSLGFINLSLSGGTPNTASPYYQTAWSWAPLQNPVITCSATAIPANTLNPSSLTCGIYSVIVSDANGCSASYSDSIIITPIPFVATFSKTDVTCYGSNDGTITVTPTTGTGPFNVTITPPSGPVINPSGNEVANINQNYTVGGLSQGSYQVVITDNNGCQDFQTIQITSPLAPITTNIISPFNVSCFGLSDGAFSVGISGGISPYTVNVTPTLPSGTPFTPPSSTVTNLSANTYNVIVYDANGCTSNISSVLISQPTPLGLSFSSNPIACYGECNGVIATTVSGGVAPYQYLWSNTATTPNINGLCAGTYTVGITDYNGCLINSQHTITQPASPVSVSIVDIVPLTCYNSNNGQLSISVNGGIGPYTATLTLIGTSTQSQLNINPSLSNIGLFSPLAAGNYTLQVMDQNGCDANFNIQIIAPLPLILNVTPTDVACYGQSTGQLSIIGNGGVAPLTYTVVGPIPSAINGSLTSGTASIVSLLPAGVYNITITDANGCNIQISTTINQAPALSILANPLPIACYGSSTSIIPTISGGAGGYNYSWTASGGGVLSSGATATSQVNIPAGVYTLTATDANSCSASQSWIILQPLTAISATATVSNLTCHNSNNGQILVSITGGTSNYTITGIGVPVVVVPTINTTYSYTSLAGGTYNLLVTDANGCTFPLNSIVVNNPPAISLTVSATSVLCNGQSTGSITFNTFGGTAPLNYLITSTNPSISGIIPSISSTNTVISNLPAGNYTVLITDANGCTNSVVITINQPPALVLTGVITNVLCKGTSTGAITTTLTGGVGPYTYNWTPGGSINNLTGIPAGNYTLIVSDLNGCQLPAQTWTVTEPLLPVSISLSSLVNISCYGLHDGSVQLSASGGTPGYQVVYQTTSPVGPVFNPAGVEINLSGGNYPNINNLYPGVYSLSVTDANGCQASSPFTIIEPPAFTASVSANTILCNPGTTGQITITTPPGSYPVTYNMTGPSPSNPSGTYSGNITTSPYTINNLAGGTYAIQLQYNNGLCSQSLSTTIIQPANPLVATPTITNILCAGQNTGSICINVTGGSAPYGYSWSTSATTNCITSLAPGTYNLIVTDNNACTINASYTISGPASPLTSSHTSSNVNCFGGNDGTITILTNGGTPPYILTSTTLSPGSTTITTQGGTYTYPIVTAGTHIVTITDANGCTSSENIVITQPSNPLTISNLSANNVLCYGDMNGQIAFNATGGTAPYTVAWSVSGLPAICSVPSTIISNSGVISAPGLCQGVYSINVTDANNCPVAFTQAIIAPNTPLIATPTQTNILCYGQCTGIATAVPSGGTAPYTHSWSSGQTTSSIPNLCMGDYYDTITDANGCEIIVQFSITAPAQAMLVTITDLDVACFDDATGSILVNVVGGTPGYNVSWTPGPPFPVAGLEINNSGGTFTIPGLLAGNYSIIVEDLNNCSYSQTVNISQPTDLTYSVASNNVTCNGLSNGSINVTVNGGVLPYSYVWTSTAGSPCSIPVNQSNATGLCPGLYSVVVTDANGCTINTSATITEPAPLVFNVVNDTVYCLPGTGTAQAIVSGGTPLYSISWLNASGTNIGNGLSIAGLTPGVYSASVTDANGCPSNATFNIIGPANPLTATISHTNETCLNNNDGTITIIPSGGTAPYNIIAPSTSPWNGPTSVQFSGGNTVSLGMVAGSYNYTISDSYGCLTTVSTSITQPTYLQATVSILNVTCNGDNDGNITITPSGATPNYTITWLSGPNTGPCILPVSQVVTGATPYPNLCPGTYVFEITDLNGCDTTISATILEPAALAITPTNTDVVCYGIPTGQAGIAVSGGTPAYTYLWTTTNGNIPGSSTVPTITNLPSGTYQVVVTDANNCTSSTTININQPVSALLAGISHTDELCFPITNLPSTGTITIGANGGTAPYTITGQNLTWTGSPIIPNPTILPPVSPAGQTMINVPSNSNGAPYTFTVTDANGCIYPPLSVVVGSPTALAVTSTPTNVLCTGNQTGAILISPSGGVSPYTVDWLSPLASGPCILPVTSTISAPYSQAGLCAGNYIISITDANGCPSTISVPITEPASFPSSISSQVNVLCHGDASGEASVSALGGTPGYTYSWTTINGNIPGSSTIDTITNLPAGTYSATITDANGCTTTNTVIITEPGTAIGAAATSTQVSCFNDTNGTITITAVGGTPPYLISGVTVPFSATIPNITNTPATLSGLAAGVYQFTVTDANLCSLTVSSTVTQPFPLVATGVSTNVLCYGQSDGEISLTITGGTPGYSYAWTGPGPIIPAGGPTITGLNIGNYSVVVTDANGCFTPVYNFNITEPPIISSSVVISDNNCNGDTTGSISVSVTGGTVPYTFEWHNGSSTGPLVTPLSTLQNISNLPAGQYTVVITDANNCVHTETATISEPSSAITISAITTNVFCNGNATGTITPTVSGGTPSYNYLWNGPSPNMPSTTLNQTNLVAGTYTLVVTDALNCNSTITFDILQPAFGITMAFTTVNVQCHGEATGAINMTVSGGTPGYNYLWYNPTNIFASTESISNLPAGYYSLQVSDLFGCTSSIDSIQIIEPLPIIFNYPSTYVDIINCHGDADANIYTSVSGGTPSLTGYLYSWVASGGGTIPSGQGSAPNLNILTPGLYTLTVTDSYGCVKDTTFTIIDPDTLTISLVSNTISCFGDSSGLITVTLLGGTGAYDISWTGSATGFPSFTTNGNPAGPELITPGNYIINNLIANVYNVTAVDANGCIAVALQDTIEQPTQINVINANIIKPLCYGDNNGSISVGMLTGGTPIFMTGYTYTWSDSLGGSITAAQAGPFPYNYSPPITLTGLTAGMYTLTVKDALNCVRTFAFIVENPDALIFDSIITTNISCKGSCSGQISFNPAGGTPGYTVNLLYFNAGNYSVIDNLVIPSQDPTGIVYNFDNLCPGLYMLQLIDAHNCSFDSVGIVLTEPSISLAATANIVASSGCTNNQGQIQVTASGGSAPYNVMWNLSPSTVNTDPLGFEIGNSGGQYIMSALPSGQYEIIVSDSNGCSISLPIFMDTLNNIAPSFTLSDTTGCAQLYINFTNTTSGTGLTYEWIFSNGTTSTLENPTIYFSTAGIYDVTLIVTNANGCTDTISEIGLIQVFPNPIASFQATTTEIDYYSGLINFVNNSTNAQFYDWDFGDLSLGSQEVNPGHLYPPEQNGGYIVTLIASDTNGCTDQTQAYFIINETLRVNVPNTVTVNSDGINDDFKPIFSNNDMVKDYELSIYNRWGELIFITNDLTEPWKINYRGLEVQSGTYNWKIVYSDDKSRIFTIAGHVNVLH
jgi:gliding motility-associated-like protein